MGSGSPSAYLLWSILSCIFQALLFLHLWLYDKFACLKWDSGRQPGAFKRVMTYSYMGTLPTLICFSVAMTALKFEEGWVALPNGSILPRPFDAWSESSRRWLLPLFFVLSFSWSLELVTHLEELAFWLFLLHQGPGKRDWFHSWEFKAWYIGSIFAVLGMPLTVLVSRHNLGTTLAWIFLVGSGAGTLTTVCFLYVIFRFPRFLEYVKAGGAEADVIVRLATFYELNCIRVTFRFIFSLPLLIIALDAIRGPYPIVGNAFATDFLLMMAGIGSFISSGITLLIFFPRSITHESGYRIKVISPQCSTTPPSVVYPEYYHDHHQSYLPNSSNPISALENPASPSSTARMSSFRYPQEPHRLRHQDPNAPTLIHRHEYAESADFSMSYETDSESVEMSPTPVPVPHPIKYSQSQPGHKRTDSKANSGAKSDDTMWERDPADSEVLPPSVLRRHSDGPLYYRHNKVARSIPQPSLREEPLRERPESQLHPYLLHFTSPIDLMDLPNESERPPPV